jgi:MoaA/NifB/PqqE/SkfB family radical SAM enzyme
MISFQTLLNAFKHVGAGGNVNPLTLARNVLPAYLSPSGYAFTPLTVFISINSVCNMKCKMCDVGQRNESSAFYKNLKPDDTLPQLSKERLFELVREVSCFHPKPRISVTTTEPFLHKDLFAFAQAVSLAGMEFQVTTNGSLLHLHLDEIFQSGVRELCVSIDAKGERHDQIRGMPGLYAKIKESLREIAGRKRQHGLAVPRITIAVTISNFNYANLLELMDDLDESLYDRAIISHMNFIDDAMVEEHNRDYAFVGKAEKAGLPGETDNYKVDVPVLWEQIRAIKSRHSKVHFAPDYNLKHLNRFYNEPDRFVWPNRCYIPWFVLEVLANGDVIPMTRCIHIIMGNIYKKTLSEIWNDQPYRRFRQYLIRYKRFSVCRRCRGLL